MRLRILSSSLKSQKGFSILSVIFCLMAFSALGLTMAPMVSVSSRGSVSSNQGQEAFFVANGGVQYILQNSFADDPNYSDNVSPTGAPFGGTPITLGTGEFWVEYSNLTPISADVTVTGRVGNSVRKVKQSVTAITILMEIGLQADGNVYLEGDGHITGDVEYTGTLDDGHYTINGDTNSGSGPPAVDLASLISQTTSFHSGNFTINGNYTGNLHVTGKLTIEGNGTITGVIVADNDVHIEAGDLTVLGTIASGNSMEVKKLENATFEAQMGASGVMNPVLVAHNDMKWDIDRNDVDVIVRGLVHAGNAMELKFKGSNSTLLIEGATWSGNDSKFKSDDGADLTIDLDAGQAYLPQFNEGVTMDEWKEV